MDVRASVYTSDNMDGCSYITTMEGRQSMFASTLEQEDVLHGCRTKLFILPDNRGQLKHTIVPSASGQ